MSFEEYIKHHHDNTLQHEIFNNFDTNHDGLLQTSEYVDAPFMAMDHNGSIWCFVIIFPLTSTHWIIYLFVSLSVSFVICLQETMWCPELTMIITTPMWVYG